MKVRRTRRLVTVVALATLTALMLLAAPALAHVTVRTDNPSAGGFAVYTVRVPNESDTAATIKVEVQMPEGLAASRYQPKPGWTISLEDGVLTAESDGGQVAPGQFDEFRFQARNPDAPTELRFPAIQTYDDGEAVEWIGAPDSDTPASVVQIQAGSGDDDHSHGDDADHSAAPADGDDDVAGATSDVATATAGSGNQLAYIALFLGALGTLAGGSALWRNRNP